MKVAVDSSALVRLSWRDENSDEAIDAFRALDSPKLMVSDLILLETETAIRAKSFIEKSGLANKHHSSVDRSMKAALSRLGMLQERGIIVRLEVEWAGWMTVAQKLSRRWAESHGLRTMDILHLAFALVTKCKGLFTCDQRQRTMAQGEGLKVIAV
jgi:predicted nucleic acid-binding protein